MIDLQEKIRACDLVLTGEGCLDEQSLVGKAAGELARLCRVSDKPLWAVPALCSESTNWEKLGFSAVKAVSVGGSIADAHGISKTVAALLKASSSS